MSDTHADAHALDETERWLTAALPGGWPPLVIVVGAGLGFVIDCLERVNAPTRVILVEPDRAAVAAMRARRDWTPSIDSGRLTILAGPEFTGATDVARLATGVAGAPVIVHPAIAAERPDDVARARDVVARLQFQADANAGARKATAGRYLLNTLVNAPRIAREADAGRLAGAFAGVPAIVAAAGPSLDRNVVDIYPVRDRALVIACDTAARPLMLHGIEPHIVVAVDSSYANGTHLMGLPSPRASLVAEGSIDPSAFTSFDGRTFFGKVSDHEPWPWLRALGLDRSRLDAWGSVATTALFIAIEAGCNPIIFAGADFAFSDGRPYARGTTLEPQWAVWVSQGTHTYGSVWDVSVNRWPETFAPDVNGRPVRTAPHLIAFRDWVVERAAARGDRRIVNGTGAGLLTGGPITQQSIGAALADAPVLDSARIFERLRERHITNREAAADLLDAATDIVTGGHAPVCDAWQAFTGGAVSRRAIEAALASPEQEAWQLAYARLAAALRTA